MTKEREKIPADWVEDAAPDVDEDDVGWAEHVARKHRAEDNPELDDKLRKLEELAKARRND